MDEFQKDTTPAGENIDGDFSLDDILNEFSDENLAVTTEVEPSADAPAKSIMPDVNNSIYAAAINSADEDETEQNTMQEPGPTPSAEDDKSDYDVVKEYKPVGGRDLDKLLREVKLDYVTDSQAAPANYASYEDEMDEGSYEPADDSLYDEPPKPEKPEHSFGQRAASPFLALMAMISMKRQLRKTTVKTAPPEDAEDLGPELDADRASRYYGSHINNLRSRTKISFGLCLVLMYISFGLPVLGALNNFSVRSLMCLILELAVVVLCLDVFTSGIMDLVRKKTRCRFAYRGIVRTVRA